MAFLIGLLSLGKFFFQCRNCTVFQFSRSVKIAFPGIFFLLKMSLFQLLFQFAASVDIRLFILPLQFHGVTVCRHFSEFLFQFLQPFL